MATIVGIAFFWALSSFIMIGLGKYDDAPTWYTVGSGGSIILLFAIWNSGRRQQE